MATTTRRARKTTTTATPADTQPTTDPTTTEEAPATQTTDPTTDTAPTTDAAPAPVSAAPVSGAPVSGVPVSGAPVSTGDHLKIVMVAGILGDHPDGVSAATIVEESGLRAAIVGRVLAAMEAAGAAVRQPAADEAGAELWVRGDAELTGVSLVTVPTYHECSCGHRHRVPTTVGVRRTVNTAPGQNSNGQRVLGKNELRAMVRDFLHAHPGHDFTPVDISKELGRSSGAIGNALTKLVIAGEAVLVKEAPATYSAPDTTTSGGN